MFNRFHNYVVGQLATINEGGRFKKPKENSNTHKNNDTAVKYDEDLFQTGRLITCGLYINIILLDYLRTIVGLNRVNSTWYVAWFTHMSPSWLTYVAGHLTLELQLTTKTFPEVWVTSVRPSSTCKPLISTKLTFAKPLKCVQVALLHQRER